MGYRTYYEMTIVPEPTTDLLQEEVYGSKIEDFMNNNLGDITWYDHDEDMLDLSLKYPEFLFTLTGEGEESDDIWRTWYKNGSTYTWSLEFTIPNFEPEKMKKWNA